MPPVIDEEKCICCGTCVEVCSEDVFYGSKEGELPVVSNPEECWHCNACVLDCKQSAVTLRLPLPAMMLHVEAGDRRSNTRAKREKGGVRR